MVDAGVAVSDAVQRQFGRFVLVTEVAASPQHGLVRPVLPLLEEFVPGVEPGTMGIEFNM